MPSSMRSRQVQSKVVSRPTSSQMNPEDQVLLFREARKAREKERLEKLRACRLRNSSAVALNVSAAISITSSAKSSASVLAPSKVIGKLGPVSDGSGAGRSQKNVHSSLGHKHEIVLKPRRSLNRRRSGSKRKVETISGLKRTQSARTYPKAEVKLTKTAQLRMLKSDPLLELSMLSGKRSDFKVLPLPESSFRSKVPLLKTKGEHVQQQHPNQSLMGQPSNIVDSAHKVAEKLSEASLKTCSPKKKTAFCSSTISIPSTPKPSPLREKLSKWLEKRDQSLDNFKHLKCFGILGPAVKRPQTPFRKTILSSSTLQAIPERSEGSCNNKEKLQDSFDEENSVLNRTFTMEDEDKENICDSMKEKVTANYGNIGDTSFTDSIKLLDQAKGVLSELFKLIQMGYPLEQCDLWLRAIRRRYPQCGDEAIYWECLASLEESRGDLQSAVSCYEQAILQGAENSVQNSLDELLKKMSALNIEPISSITMKKENKNKECQHLNSSNIIKSSAIHFVVQEKANSCKKENGQDAMLDTLFKATPVRRSTRLADVPKQTTPGITCVRSLNFLEPNVRNSLIFQGNSALEPSD